MDEMDPRPQNRSAWSDTDDARLAIAASKGDVEAFGELVERHHETVYRLAAALLGDGPDAEDAAQDALVRAYENVRRYDPKRPFGPWLRGVTVRACRQQLRNRARRERRSRALEVVQPLPPDGRRGEHPHPVMTALARLEDMYRLPLVLFYLEQAKVAEVAEALGLSVGAARVRLHRGREKLRRMLSRGDAAELIGSEDDIDEL